MTIKSRLRKSKFQLYVVYQKPTLNIKTQVKNKVIEIKCHANTKQKKAEVAIFQIWLTSEQRKVSGIKKG